jgi:hypothetical protein
VHRENHPDRVNTDGLRSDRLVGNDNLDRAVWFNTGLDQSGGTTLFTHTAETSETYALHGSSAGFAAEGGTGELSEYAEASRVTLYEYVTDKTFEEADRLGIDIQFGSVERVVDEPDVHYEIPVTADAQDGVQAILLKDGATVATATFGDGGAMLQLNLSDIEPGAHYVVVALDDTDVLGATPLPADAIPADAFVESALAELAQSLEGYVASGAVAGPIAHQLENALDQATFHLEAGRTGPAETALKRFVRHLDEPKRPDTLTAEARDDLRGQSEVILDLMTG